MHTKEYEHQNRGYFYIIHFYISTALTSALHMVGKNNFVG